VILCYLYSTLSALRSFSHDTQSVSLLIVNLDYTHMPFGFEYDYNQNSDSNLRTSFFFLRLPKKDPSTKICPKVLYDNLFPKANVL